MSHSCRRCVPHRCSCWQSASRPVSVDARAAAPRLGAGCPSWSPVPPGRAGPCSTSRFEVSRTRSSRSTSSDSSWRCRSSAAPSWVVVAAAAAAASWLIERGPLGGRSAGSAPERSRLRSRRGCSTCRRRAAVGWSALWVSAVVAARGLVRRRLAVDAAAVRAPVRRRRGQLRCCAQRGARPRFIVLLYASSRPPSRSWSVPCSSSSSPAARILGERRKTEGLRFLYGAVAGAAACERSRRLDRRARSRSCETFQAELAELVVYDAVDPGTAYVTTVGPGGHRSAMVVCDRADVDGRSARRTPCSARRSSRPSGAARASRASARRRHAGSGRLKKDQLRLLHTFAGQLVTTLEKSQINESLAKVRVLKNEFADQASHDSLTGLATAAVPPVPRRRSGRRGRRRFRPPSCSSTSTTSRPSTTQWVTPLETTCCVRGAAHCCIGGPGRHRGPARW